MILCETHLTTAVVEAGGGQILQILGGQAAHWNVKTGIGETFLLLRMNAVVGAGRGVEHGAGIGSQWAEELFHLAAEHVVTHLIQVEAEAAFGALVALTVIAPEPDHGVGHLADFVWLHPGVQGNGIGVHL